MTTITGTNMERETRECLGASLARLAAIKPDDLIHPIHSKISFRNGRSDFERTLGVFQKVARSDLRQVPSEYLKIVADEACETLARLHEIQNFTGDGVEHPEQVRKARTVAILGMIMEIAVIAAVITGYHYALYSLFTDKVLGAIH